MSAGTVVISGGLLATVILLCIVAVLCYCRLQYYCCKKNESEVDLASMAGGGEGMGGGDGEGDAHFACNACSAPGMDSLAVTPLCLEPLEVGPPPSYCPTCSPFWLRPGLSDKLHNGTERLGFHTYHYDNPGLCQSLPLSDTPQSPFFLTQPGQSPLSYYSPVDTYPNTPCSNRRPYSTPV